MATGPGGACTPAGSAQGTVVAQLRVRIAGMRARCHRALRCFTDHQESSFRCEFHQLFNI